MGDMKPTIATSVDWIKAVVNLQFPPKADNHLQELMNRNNEGHLKESEKEDLEALVELSEELSLVRAEALQILAKHRGTIADGSSAGHQGS
jgi:hypothetical protein